MRATWILRAVLVIVCLAVIIVPTFWIANVSGFLVWIAVVVAVLALAYGVDKVFQRRVRES